MKLFFTQYLKQKISLSLFFLLFCGVQASWGQITISSQDFEATPATPTLTFSNTNGGNSTGNNPAGGNPASSPLFVSGARGWQANNATSTLTFANQSLAGYTNCFVDFRLAGMSVNATNGIDGADIARILISVDGGTTYSNEVEVIGSAANQRWAFTATGSSTTTYDGNNTPTSVSSPSATGISTVTVNIPNANTQVRVRIVLLNNDANERWVIDDVRVRGTASATSTSTLASSATLTEPATISSLNTAFTGAIAPQLNAVNNFDFNIENSDASAIQFSQLVLNTGTGNGVTSWTNALQEAQLSDGTNTVTSTSITANTITFASLTNTLGNIGHVPVGTKTYTLKVRFKTAMGGTAPTTIDGQDFVFLVDNSSFTFVAGGLASSQAVNSGDGNNTVGVVATQLAFITQPSNTTVNATMTSPTVQATDANGNRDLGYVTTVSVTSTGTLNVTPKTATPTTGLATFSTIVHTTIGTGLTLTASSGSLTSAVSNTFDIVAVSYCTPAPSSVDGNGITNVLMGTINNTTGAEAGNYGNYSAQSTNVVQGATQSCAITYQTGFTYNTKIWIDLNNDGDFGDVGEEVYSGVSTASNPTTLNASFVIPIATPVGSYRLRIGGADASTPTTCYTGTFASYEDYTINVIAPCTPTHTIASFLPTSGTIGTMVVITGTGFTASSTVKFGTVSATSVTFLSSTQIVAEVPTGFTTENIKVTEASCDATSASTFSRIENAGTCTPAITALILSELYDAQAGSIGYIELYNGTASTIDLTTYFIDRFNDNTGSATHTYTFPASGAGSSIAPGEVLVGKVSSEANISGVTPDFTFTGSTSGYNEDDRLELWNGATQIDEVIAQGVSVGYSYYRKPTVTAPNTVFTASEWTTDDPEETADLGTFGSPTLAPSVTSNPNDVTSCSFTMSVTATGTSLTYQWLFNDRTTMTGWQNVTTANLTTAKAGNSGVTVSGATTASLTLTGNLANLYDYQFYCQVTSGTCSKLSNAAQFTYNTRPVYRSVTSASGNWTTVANWEMANTTAGPWVTTCTYPTASNSSEVIIQNGTNIVLDIDNDVDKITIETTGTLEIGIASRLTLNNGATGADLILNGTLLYRANSTKDLVFSTNATWTFGSGATFIKTNTASAVNLRDNYEGGISTIPAVGDWIYRYNGDGNVAFVTVDMFYPNLTIDKSTAGLWDASMFSSKFSGSTGGFATVKGNMDVGGTNTGTVTIYNENFNTQPMLILGNLTVRAGNTLTNNGSGDKGRGFEIKGNLTVNGTFTVNATDVNVTSPILKFSNTTGEQTIAGTGTLNIHELDVNKTSAFDLKLLRSITVGNLVDLQVGDINLNGFNIDMGTTATLNENVASDYLVKDLTATTEASVGGYIRFSNRNINNTQTSIGGSRLWLHWTAGADYTVNFDRYHYSANGKAIKLIYRVAVNSGTMGATNLRISYADYELFTLLETLNVARWASGAGWSSYIADATDASANYSQRNGITAFSHWTLTDTNVLLASPEADLKATQVGKQASLVQWANVPVGKTILQKSIDGLTFQDLAEAEQAFTDNDFRQDAYYRLQTTHNRQTQYSKAVFLRYEAGEGIYLYPNPYKQGGQARLYVGDKTLQSLHILDVQGRIVGKTSESMLSHNLDNLPAGTYILKALTNKGVHYIRFVKL